MINKIVNFTLDIANIESITGNELNCLKFLEDFLAKNSILYEKIYISENRYNIFAYFVKKEKYKILFCSHIDTVAPFVPVYQKNDKIFGRGVLDAKGIIASMLFAMMELSKNGFKDIGLLITVGEETLSDGAKFSNLVLKNRAHYVVVGEPTCLKFAEAQKGSLVFDVLFFGKEAHSSLTHLGFSSINEASSFIYKASSFKWPNNENFGETLINFGKITGGNSRNTFASFTKLEGIMRLSMPYIEAKEKLESFLPSKNSKLEILSFSEPFSYFIPNGYEQFIAGFGSDAPYLKDIGKTILVGPGDLAYAHKEDEQILISDLQDGFDLYKKLPFILP